MDKSKIKKIVLAYSGGLDTSVIIPWLKEHYNDPEIIAVAADVGQGDELDGLEEKAIKTGASKLIIADLTDEMCDEIIVPSVMMDAKYEKYLLGTAQGQRSGPVRAGYQALRTRHGDHRAVERVGDQVP